MTQLALAVLACGTGGCSSDETEEHPPPTYSCLQGFNEPVEYPDASVRERYTGLNGEFTDTCQDGNLIQYECEMMTIIGPPSDPAQYTYATGDVVSTNIDCRERMFDGAPGRCVRGACQR